jgi:hypothetical protein
MIRTIPRSFFDTRMSGAAFAVALGMLAVACVDPPPDTLRTTGSPGVDDPTGEGAGGTGVAHDHGASGIKDPLAVLAQRREEGPPEVRTRLHSCQKLQLAALSGMLEAFGVDLDATGDPRTAGQLLAASADALGAASYDASAGESIVWTATGARKLFDVFLRAAPELIAGVEHAPQCRLGGANPTMFDGSRCDIDAVTCLLGRPATEQLLALCDDLVASASDVETGKKIAVAALLSAAHTCE